LIEAVRKVHAGESVLHPAIARKVINRFAPTASKRAEESVQGSLTEREMEVLKLAAKGMTNQEIAQELTLSVRTVQTHLSNIFGKMQVGSRTEAVLQGLKQGWLVLDDTR
jgi:two-component system, NarL family, response regulator LiaR